MSTPRNLRVLLAYDGARFFGWQRQAGFLSVQEALEEAIDDLTGEPATVYGSGRTDTGVHALGQVASFQLSTAMADDRLRHALNAHLPQGVVIRRLETCAPDFNALRSACGKRYLYLTATTRFRPPFAQQHCHWVQSPLDRAALERAAAQVVGTHDFVAFGNAGSPRKSTVRTVHALRVVARRERMAFVIQGSGFLYKMVRTIAGTLIDVGRGRLDPDCVSRALQTGERTEAGPTAPAAGLYLLRVMYDEPVFQGPDRGPRGAPGLFS